jgi:hypothetical protein
MPTFGVFVLVAAGLSAGPNGGSLQFVVPNVPDLTIRTRETIDRPQSTIQINTLYFKAAWQRRDRELQFRFPLPAQRTVRHTTITQCDDRRILELNHDARLYARWPLNSGRDLYWLLSRWWQRPEPLAAGADVKVTIDTVDTGDRRQLGSYSARHVITTITTDPNAGANTRPSEAVVDGWYIDLPRAECSDAGDGHFLATGSVLSPGRVPDRINVEFHGAGRRGFPVEETKRHRGEHEPPIVTRVKLIEFSEAVLDKSLFDIPGGYRPALPRLIGHVDLTKPDTVANRVQAYWQDAATLTREFFRF